VSSLAGSLSPRARPFARALDSLRVSADTALTWGVGLALAAVAFAASGGLRLERTTWTEIVLMLAGAGLVAAALLTRRIAPPLHGSLTLLGLTALAVYTALSINWSLSPADSWLEANRAFAYVGAFAGALALVRLVPHRWAAVLNGVALACVIVCGWALLTKVFPEALAPDETFARLRDPFGYWNAVGLMAALGVLPLLWLAARRTGSPAVNALAWPALGLLFVCMMMSYSRGALVALAFGLAFWFAVVPLRLRAAAPLIAAAVAAAPVVAWAFARDALSVERIPLAARSDAGHDLGALLLVVGALLLIAGLAVNFLAAQHPPSPRTRRLAGRGLLGGLAVIPVAVLIAIAASPGGLSGKVTSGWDKLTNPAASSPANTPERLTATSSVRARYWKEALDVYKSSKFVGAGAGAFVVARTRYRTDRLVVRHAHGYGVQTLADLGLIGVGLSLLAALAWAVAAMRATGLRPRDRGLPFDPERIGLLTLAAVVVTFGVHSLIDWTWVVPGNAVLALVCAAWVAGRPAMRTRLAAPEEPAPAPAAGPRRPWRERVGTLPRRPSLRGVAALGAIAAALAASWAALQPVRSANAQDAAMDKIDTGDYAAAARDARTAEKRNPLSLDPIWLLAFIDDAQMNTRAATHDLERAAISQPANTEAWRRLGRYRLTVLGDAQGAVDAFGAAYFLDPAALETASDLIEATRVLHAKK
jgi:O-Antigen ligase